MISRFCLILIGIFAAQMLFGQSINSEKSEVKFSLSNLGLNTVNGTLTDMEGSIQFNADDVSSSSFNVCVSVSTIETGIDKRNEHLKDKDFFHASKYPTICFKSTSVGRTTEGYEATGHLTMHGVTKTVTIPFNYEKNTFTGQFIVYRLDYKIGEDTSTFTAGNEVEITINCIVE